MSGSISYWDVVFDGGEYSIIEAGSPTNHRVISSNLPLVEASRRCNQLSKEQQAMDRPGIGKKVEGALDAALEATGEMTGKRVKSFLDGFRRGRQ